MQEFKLASIKEALADGGRPCMPIKALLADRAFDAETTRLLGQAYDLACSELHDDGQPAVVKEIIAKVRLVNAMAEKLFGYTRLELIGQNVEVLVPDRLVNAHEALRNNYMSAPETRAMGIGRDLNARHVGQIYLFAPK
jgi:PAS domain-containing protein